MNYQSYFQTTLQSWLCESLLRRQMIDECHTLYYVNFILSAQHLRVISIEWICILSTNITTLITFCLFQSTPNVQFEQRIKFGEKMTKKFRRNGNQSECFSTGSTEIFFLVKTSFKYFQGSNSTNEVGEGPLEHTCSSRIFQDQYFQRWSKLKRTF